MRIGRGEKLADITESMNAVAEGVLTSRAANDLANKLGVDCPVLSGIHKARGGVPCRAFAMVFW